MTAVCDRELGECRRQAEILTTAILHSEHTDPTATAEIKPTQKKKKL